MKMLAPPRVRAVSGSAQHSKAGAQYQCQGDRGHASFSCNQGHTSRMRCVRWLQHEVLDTGHSHTKTRAEALHFIHAASADAEGSDTAPQTMQTSQLGHAACCLTLADLASTACETVTAVMPPTPHPPPPAQSSAGATSMFQLASMPG